MGRRSIVHCCFAFFFLLARSFSAVLSDATPFLRSFLPAYLPTCCLNAVRVYPSVHAVSQGMWRFETLDSKSCIVRSRQRGYKHTHTRLSHTARRARRGTEEAAAWMDGEEREGRAAAVTHLLLLLLLLSTYYRRYGLRAAARVRPRRDTVALLTALSVLYDTHSSFGGRRSDAGGCWVVGVVGK